MEILNDPAKVIAGKGSAVTIGTYDGVHLGHKAIIDRLKAVAAEKGLWSTVITFEPHPRNVLAAREDFKVPLLSDAQEKAELLEEQGIERLVVITFDERFAEIDYKKFLYKTLLKKLKMGALIIGYNHTFGKDRKGNYDSLMPFSEKEDFYLEKVEPLFIKGEKISSTQTRVYLNNGDVENAAKMLGRRYSLRGTVVKGDGRGKELSFPTANISISDREKLVPAHGVYAVDVDVDKEQFKGMMNIGERPTFKDSLPALEAHIFGLDHDIYDKTIRVYFKKRLRDEKKFDSPEALKKQLKKDKEKSLSL